MDYDGGDLASTMLALLVLLILLTLVVLVVLADILLSPPMIPLEGNKTSLCSKGKRRNT